VGVHVEAKQIVPRTWKATNYTWPRSIYLTGALNQNLDGPLSSGIATKISRQETII
jgi:hypothetical protein